MIHRVRKWRSELSKHNYDYRSWQRRRPNRANFNAYIQSPCTVYDVTTLKILRIPALLSALLQYLSHFVGLATRFTHPFYGTDNHVNTHTYLERKQRTGPRGKRIALSKKTSSLAGGSALLTSEKKMINIHLRPRTTWLQRRVVVNSVAKYRQCGKIFIVYLLSTCENKKKCSLYPNFLCLQYIAPRNSHVREVRMHDLKSPHHLDNQLCWKL